MAERFVLTMTEEQIRLIASGNAQEYTLHSRNGDVRVLVQQEPPAATRSELVYSLRGIAAAMWADVGGEYGWTDDDIDTIFKVALLIEQTNESETATDATSGD
jgi:hypothetical protein